MAEIINEILEWCVKFDQHRPHFKVLSNQYASVFLICIAASAFPRLVKAKIFSKYRIRNFFHTHEKSTLKARATSM